MERVLYVMKSRFSGVASQLIRQNEVFQPSEEFHFNACIGHNGGLPNYERMAGGYFDACKRLVESVCGDSIGMDYIIYPLVSNFRHGIELYLKHFNEKLPLLMKCEHQKITNHNLLQLWNRVRPMLRKQFGKDEYLRETEETIDTVIRCTVEIDPDQMHFRYPVSKKEDAPHLTEWSLISVSRLGQYISETSRIFDLWATVVNAELDNHDEYMSAMRELYPEESYDDY